MCMSPFSMLRRSMKFLLARPVTWAANRFSSAPNQADVNKALTELYGEITSNPGKEGLLINFRPSQHPVIIFTDLHKGARNGSDDFMPAEETYLAALDYYNQNGFYYLNLGDSEELWENNIFQILTHNKATFEAEKAFIERKAYARLSGNHDLYWQNDPFAPVVLRMIYGHPVRAFSGVVLRVAIADRSMDIFCTHGHQGDAQSDGNAFSKWFVSWIWGPLQAFLDVNTNTPAVNHERKTLHNEFMYEWSAAQKDLILITGHTHQPVFNSLTHLERLYLDLEHAIGANDKASIEQIKKEIPKRKKEYDHVNSKFREMKPSYFNAGCCCFDGGTITGIEIAEGQIRLVKWVKEDNMPVRKIAEEESLLLLSQKITGV